MWGFGGMVYRKFFEILHDVMAFLVLFKQILTKRFTSHSESFIKYDAFCLHIFACLVQAGSGSRIFW